MALVFEDPAAPGASEGGLHAFIVGVSRYKHLPSGDGDPARDSFGMQQLTSTALSAYRVYEWLLQRRDRLPRRLATIHMLLSPSAKELEVEPGIRQFNDPALRALRARFAAEAKSWRARTKASNNEFAFFYFAGHGLEREKGDCVLLCEDFGDPDQGDDLVNTVDFDHLFAGMAPPDRRTESIARSQVYFVDACRAKPASFSLFERQQPPGLWRIELGGRDDRQAPVFFAAIPGTEAIGFDGEETLFNRALMACLKQDAVHALPEQDADGNPKYGVSVYTLHEGLKTAIAALNAKNTTHQAHSLTGRVSDLTLHYIDGRPDVDVVVEIDPAAAVPFVQLDVSAADDTSVLTLTQLNPHPYRHQLPAGIYRFRFTVDPRQPFRNPMPSFEQVKPPRHPVRARVRP